MSPPVHSRPTALYTKRGEPFEPCSALGEPVHDLVLVGRIEHVSRAQLTVPTAEAMDVLLLLIELSEGELLIADLFLQLNSGRAHDVPERRRCLLVLPGHCVGIPVERC